MCMYVYYVVCIYYVVWYACMHNVCITFYMFWVGVEYISNYHYSQGKFMKNWTFLFLLLCYAEEGSK